VDSYPDIRTLARGATEDYSRIDALEQIRPPYPAHGSPNWWALRLRYEMLLAERLNRLRRGSDMKTAFNIPEAIAAKWAAIGHEAADRDYQSFVKALGPNHSPRRKDWLHAAAEAIGRVA
jgi:hypothetical protein